MKSSITGRLFRTILLIVLGFAALILLTNTLLLRPLYFQSIRNNLLAAMSSLEQIDYTRDEQVWLQELGEINQGKAFDVVIRSDDEIAYSSSSELGLYPRHTGQTAAAQRNDQLNLLRQLREHPDVTRLEDGTYIGLVRLASEGSNVMACYKALPDGTSIILTQPVAPVNQSILQSNILLAACTLLAVIIGAFVAFRLSKRFTKPIRQIEATVGEMAALNFAHQCDVRTGDELEHLAGDVNQLGSRLQNAMRTLKRQNEKLEKDVQMQKLFISNASHELRTPLSLIKGYADEMNMEGEQQLEQRKAYIEIIAEEAAKMNRLLGEMLELSRMESGSVDMRCETLPVGLQIEQFLEKYDGYISEQGLNVSVRLAKEAIGYFDPVRFEQVLANYISNAARYGDEQKRIEISTRMTEDAIRITVFNSGEHIDEMLMENMWDSFYKADAARRRSENSYGLGLSIVKAIQNVAGRQFGARNVTGGVEFWFDVAQAKTER